MKNNKNYYLGLDMGTSSVGWAVTDENYVLLRARGKDMWGIREFEEAKTSVERRTNRVTRRCRQREVARIGLLKEFFHEAVSEVDPSFFIRLENSKYYLEDKNEEVHSKYALFNDTDYTDSDYFKQYPTIFHLRKELINNTEKHDVRLIYLAVLNMFKHRGHFLDSATSSDDSELSVDDAYRGFVEGLDEVCGISLPTINDAKIIGEILGSRDRSRTIKAEEIGTLLGVEKKKKIETAWIKMISGLKVESKNLMDYEEEPENSISICFSDYGFDDKEQDIKDVVGEELFTVIDLAHTLFNIGTLSQILKNYNFLSEAMVADYEKHAADLKKLKHVIRKYGSLKDYDDMFRAYEENNYCAYIGSVNSGEVKKRRNIKGRKKDDLYKRIRKLIQSAPFQQEDPEINSILKDIENDNFLPKQRNAANGVIPNQIHAKELHRILSNASAYLPFLKEADERGLTVQEKIEKLFSFQIPYYIGPLSEASHNNGGNGWVVRKESGAVYPWNLNEKIDENKTREKFIENLIRECSYLSGEKVMPRASLMYEKYCVLNEINKIKVKGEPIDVPVKQDIYRELFERGKKVSRKNISKWLINRGLAESEDDVTGIDTTVNSSLSTYGKFRAILGDKILEDRYKEIVDDIVKLSTIYGDAKKVLNSVIREKYGEEFDDASIKRILGMKFKDWGRLSKEFLEMPGCNTETGEEISIIRALWETNYNLMELINSDEFTFKKELENKRTGALGTLVGFEYDDLNDMYFSAPVKRMVWQTILVIREIEKVMGCPPKRLFVEMTRRDGEKVRTKSRKQKFTELYKNIKENQKEWLGLIEKSDNDGVLKSKKMYLYLTQMGKCMYSGESINLDDLFDDNKYDIDHIYPRHFVKDDNIDNNLVLVKKQINNHKSDDFPLEESIYVKCNSLWRELKQKGLITEEKYNRLMSRSPLTDSQKADFIARQLVETAQGTKGVTELIKQLLGEETTVVYSKASNVSEFRHEYDIPKSRLVNDFHHAHDAYLNIVVGNVYYTKFTQNPRNFIEKDFARGEKYNLSKMFIWDVRRDGYTAWVGNHDGEHGTIQTVKKMLAKQTPLLTRMSFEQHGALANATLYGKEAASPENYVPLKTNDPKMADVTKYGGFTSVSGTYFFLVEHEKKGKKVRSIEALPLSLKDKAENNKQVLEDYCVRELKLEKPSIRLEKIKYQSLLKLNGYYVHLSGRTGNRLIIRNATSLKLSSSDVSIVKKLDKTAENNELCDGITDELCIELFDRLITLYSKGILSKRPNSITSKVSEKREFFIKLDLLSKCKLLLQLIQAYKIGVAFADLSTIKLAPQSGVMLMSKNISDNGECSIINQSVTGLYESRIDLLTV